MTKSREQQPEIKVSEENIEKYQKIFYDKGISEEKARWKKKMMELIEEPKDKVNSAQKFLINNGCGDLVLNEVMPRDKWNYTSDIMILFLKWKVKELLGDAE